MSCPPETAISRWACHISSWPLYIQQSLSCPVDTHYCWDSHVQCACYVHLSLSPPAESVTMEAVSSWVCQVPLSLSCSGETVFSWVIFKLSMSLGRPVMYIWACMSNLACLVQWSLSGAAEPGMSSWPSHVPLRLSCPAVPVMSIWACLQLTLLCPAELVSIEAVSSWACHVLLYQSCLGDPVLSRWAYLQQCMLIAAAFTKAIKKNHAKYPSRDEQTFFF